MIWITLGARVNMNDNETMSIARVFVGALVAMVLVSLLVTIAP